MKTKTVILISLLGGFLAWLYFRTNRTAPVWQKPTGEPPWAGAQWDSQSGNWI